MGRVRAHGEEGVHGRGSNSARRAKPSQHDHRLVQAVPAIVTGQCRRGCLLFFTRKLTRLHGQFRLTKTKAAARRRQAALPWHYNQEGTQRRPSTAVRTIPAEFATRRESGCGGRRRHSRCCDRAENDSQWGGQGDSVVRSLSSAVADQRCRRNRTKRDTQKKKKTRGMHDEERRV